MAQWKNGITGVHIARNFIALAQYVPNDNAVASIVIKPLDETTLKNVNGVQLELKKLIADIRFTGQNTVCSLPSECAVLKRVLIDATEDQINETLEFELEQQIIGSLDEYVYDFQNIPQHATPEKHEYLLVAYRCEAVANISSLIRGCKLNPYVVDLDIFALINVFEVNYRDVIQEPALIVYGEEGRSKLVLTHNGVFIDVEPILWDGSTPAQFAGACTVARTTIMSANESCAHQGPPVFLAGPVFTSKEMVDGTTGAMPSAQMLNPFKAIPCLAEMAKEDLEKYSPQMTVAVGLAIREGM